MRCITFCLVGFGLLFFVDGEDGYAIQSPVFHIDGATISPGETTADVFIRVTAISPPTDTTDGVSGIQCVVKYDATKLQATPSDVFKTPLTDKWFLESHQTEPGELSIAMVHYSLTGQSGLTSDGQVVRITFTVLSTFTTGNSSLELTPLGGLLINPSAGVATIAGKGKVEFVAAPENPDPQDVTNVSQSNQFAITFNRRTGEFSMRVTWRNIGANPLGKPLKMYIENLNPANVTVANADGIAGDRPFFDFSNFAGGDGKLAAGETSVARQLIFNNPSRARVTFDIRFEAVVLSTGAAPGGRSLLGVGMINQPIPIPVVIPVVSAVGQNFPNPFNPETWIPYEIAQAGPVAISIYDAQGLLVRRLKLGYQQMGQYATHDKAAYWDGKNHAGERVGSGVYFYHLQVKNGGVSHLGTIKKMVILK